MKSPLVVWRVWLMALVICLIAITLSFLYVDVPVTLYFAKSSAATSPLLTQASKDLGSTIILSSEALILLAVVSIYLLSEQRLPLLAVAVGLSCLASICAFGFDTDVLKPFFGVPNPGQFLDGMPHTFHFWGGSAHSGFPSGHMMLAAPIAGVFMRFYRKSIGPLSALLMLGCALLVIGGWHFLSDVIAGTFLGLSVGLLAAELWMAQAR